jgi:signal peptidase
MEGRKMNNDKKQNQTLKEAKGFMLIIIVVVLCFYAVIGGTKIKGQAVPMIFGKGCAVVMTGSMEPNIPIDALIFIDETDNYQVGDVVVINKTGYNPVVHRIVSIENDEVITKGDANNTVDEPVTLSNLNGKVIGYIPYVGLVINYIKTPLGSLTLILVFLLLWSISNKKASKEEEDESNS